MENTFAFSDCGKLTVVLIPKSVATIGNNVFGNDNTDFYCESLGVPSGWSNDKANNKIWNGGKGTIHWEISFIADSIAYFVTGIGNWFPFHNTKNAPYFQPIAATIGVLYRALNFRVSCGRNCYLMQI